MDIEVLIPTHHKSIEEIRDIVKRSHAEPPVLVCNQNEIEGSVELPNLRIVCSNDIGVGRNRNNLLGNAQGDICVCIDDDCSLVPDYKQLVNAFFSNHPDAELVLFNGIVTKESNRLIHKQKTKRVRLFADVAYGGGPGLVFKRSSMERLGLRYREDIGYPNEIIFGEDSAFLMAIAKSDAVFYRSSEVLFSIDEDVDNSVYFNGVNERFLLSKGFCAKMLHPHFTKVFLLRYAWRLRNWRGNRNRFWTMVRLMNQGAKRYKKN